MFFPAVLATSKLPKPILIGLLFLGVLVTLFIVHRIDPEEVEIRCITLEGFDNPVKALAFSPDGKTLATGEGWLTRTEDAKPTRTGEVKLWNVKKGTQRASIGKYPNAIQSLAFSPEGKILAIGCDGTVSLWDLPRGQNNHVFGCSEAREDMVAFSPDGRTLATWGTNGLRLRDLTTGSEQTIQGVTGPVAFCPDDRCLGITCFHDVTICDALKGNKLFTLAPDRYALWTVVFSPDGRTVAARGHDGTVTVWDANTGEERFALQSRQDRANVVAFSPDGKTLASGGLYGTVSLWAVDTGEERACWHEHTRSVTALAFAPDGKKLASGSYDQTAKIWHLP